MGDGSRSSLVKSLKGEWNLLWESIAGEDAGAQFTDGLEENSNKLEVMTLEQIKQITRSLSDDRKILNQKLEKLNKEIELNTAKLESLRLVGSQDDSTLKRMMELTDQGQLLSDTLHKIDQKLRLALKREEEIIESSDEEDLHQR